MNKKTILLINGLPGTGKLTVAKEICNMRDDILYIDNHKINNALFQVIDIKKRLPNEVFSYIDNIYDVLFDMMKKVDIIDKSFIFTNVFFDENIADKNFNNKLTSLADDMGYRYIPINLVCDRKELHKRLVNEDRIINMKLTDIDLLEDFIKYKTLANFNSIEINNTNMSAKDVAEQIINLLRNLD
jgi:SpoVK/Ycf46/Vps4 family AAA+-type ATPase